MKDIEKSQFAIVNDCKIGDGTTIRELANLYKCNIGKNCKIGCMVYMEEGVVVGESVKIKPFVFIPTGVRIEDNVFIGPSVTFTNDKYPKVKGEWTIEPTIVKKGASIGANSVIICGVTIGEEALVGAGSVVTKDVPSKAIVAGNPAKIIGRVNFDEKKL